MVRLPSIEPGPRTTSTVLFAPFSLITLNTYERRQLHSTGLSTRQEQPREKKSIGRVQEAVRGPDSHLPQATSIRSGPYTGRHAFLRRAVETMMVGARLCWNGQGLTVLALAALALWILVGPVAAQGETRLKLVAWKYPYESKMRPGMEVIDRFENDHPGVRIDFTRGDWADAHGRVRRWMSEHRAWAPDMTVVPHTWLAEIGHQFYTFRSTFLPTLAPFIPAVMNGAIVEKRIHGVPWRTQSWALYYRTDLLPEGSGPPESWEQLRGMQKALRGPDGDIRPIGIPGAVGGESARSLLVALWGYGGSLYDDEGAITFDTPEMAEALELWVDLRREGIMQPEMLSWSLSELETAFAEGRIATLMAPPRLTVRLNETTDLAFDTAPLPAAQTPVATVSPTYLVILRSSPHRQQCMEFLQYIASEQGQADMTALGAVPVHEDVLARVEEDSPMGAFAANLDHAHITPPQDWPVMRTLLEDAVFLALSGRCGVQETLERIQQRWDSPRQQ